jgi:hypothetical protein
LFRQSQLPIKRPEFFQALSELAKIAGSVNWGNVPFSITQAVLDAPGRIGANGRSALIAKHHGAPADQIDSVLIVALLLFADIVNTEMTAANTDSVSARGLLDALIAEVAEDFSDIAAAKEKWNEQILQRHNEAIAQDTVVPFKVVQPGEIYTERMLARVFNPAPLNEHAATSLYASLVTFRGHLPTGELGPTLRGISFEGSTNEPTVLLETGELVRPGKENLAGTNTADDYAQVCPELLAYTVIAANDLWSRGVLNTAQHDYVAINNILGGFKDLPHHHVTATCVSVESLSSVVAARDSGVVTGPTGAAANFPVPNTDFVVVLEALVGTTGPVCTAKLLKAGKVVMRLDRPRQFSTQGVYLFPLTDAIVSMSVIY